MIGSTYTNPAGAMEAATGGVSPVTDRSDRSQWQM
jgi:hypothetical protein